MKNEMTEIEDEKITVEVDGVEKEFDVLFKYDSPDVDYTYAAITDNTFDAEGNLAIRFIKASAFTEMNYVPVTDPEELEMMDKILQDILKKMQEQ